MTLLGFENPYKSLNRKKRQEFKPSHPHNGYGYHASHTSVNLPPTPPTTPHYRPVPASPPIQPPRPANPGWTNGMYSSPPNMAVSTHYLAPPHPPTRPPLRQTQSPPYSPPQGWATPSTMNVPRPGTSPYQQQSHPKQKSKWRSTTNLLAPMTAPFHAASASMTNLEDSLRHTGREYLNGTALCDLISSKLNAVITCIDGDNFNGEEKELVIYQPSSPPVAHAQLSQERARGYNQRSKSIAQNYFSKCYFYANSRLPPYLPPFKVYLPTWPLLVLAVQYSTSVYKKPTSAERETHIPADNRTGAKAMVLKCVLKDDIKTIVFAIRGSQTFSDWAVNYRTSPTAAEGFLDDADNACHEGFLSVAQRMVGPVVAGLRDLLAANPAITGTYSLLITGHSAGGAVAQLLYAHMLSTTVGSELNHLTCFFKRVHCVTFGAPPVSLLPLRIPTRDAGHHPKSLFYAFINEGDPVARADKAVIASLLRLYTSPAPQQGGSGSSSSSGIACPITGAPVAAGLAHAVGKKASRSNLAVYQPSQAPVWPVPPGELSLAGSLVLLRNRPLADKSGRPVPALSGSARAKGAGAAAAAGGKAKDEDVEACVVRDEDLRGVVFGDPVCHMMKLYTRRIEALATKAVLVRGS